MNKISFSVVILLFAAKVYAQAAPPKYAQAAIQFKNFYNHNKPDSIFNQFSPEMKVALPEDKFTSTTAQLKTQLGSLLKTEFYKYDAPLAVYKATFQNAVFLLNISLNDKDQYTGLLLSPYQDPAKEDPSIIESPVLVKNLSVTISGTLAMPKN